MPVEIAKGSPVTSCADLGSEGISSHISMHSLISDGVEYVNILFVRLLDTVTNHLPKTLVQFVELVL